MVIWPLSSALAPGTRLDLARGIACPARLTVSPPPAGRARLTSASSAMGFALAVALLMQPAAADTIIMRNGDRLTGKVVRKEGGELLVRTDYAGTIALDWTQVRDIQLDPPVPVLLENESSRRSLRRCGSSSGEVRPRVRARAR